MSAGSPRSTRPAGSGSRSRIPTTRPRWPCRWTTVVRSRGEDVTTSVWQSYPTPALEGFQVQPRSLAMFRAEQMITMGGTITLATDEGPRRIDNTTDLELRDAVLIDVNGPEDLKETSLGTIGPGATVEVKAIAAPPSEAFPKGILDPTPFLREFRTDAEDRPEENGGDPARGLVAQAPRRPGAGADRGPASRPHRRGRSPPQRPAPGTRWAPLSTPSRGKRSGPRTRGRPLRRALENQRSKFPAMTRGRAPAGACVADRCGAVPRPATVRGPHIMPLATPMRPHPSSLPGESALYLPSPPERNEVRGL